MILRSGGGAIINPGEHNALDNNIFAENAVGIYFQAVAPFDSVRPPLGDNRLLRNIILTRSDGIAYSLRNWNGKNLAESDFNVFWNAKGPVWFQTQADSRAPLRNLSLAEWRNLTFDRGSVVADPLFCRAAARRLSSGSNVSRPQTAICSDRHRDNGKTAVAAGRPIIAAVPASKLR